MEEVLANIKSFLLMFDYPLVKSMNDDEIAEIFNGSNRCFLVHWMVKLLNSNCEDTLKGLQYTEDYLANLLHKIGICKKEEAVLFMKAELAVKRQLEIIQSLLSSIKRTSDSVPEEQVTFEDLAKLQTMDLNLFPMFGDIKMNFTKDEKTILDDTMEETAVMVDEEDAANKFEQHIEKELGNIREVYPSVLKQIDLLEREEAHYDKESIMFDASFGEIAAKCNNYMTVVNQFLDDCEIIEKFNVGALVPHCSDINVDGGIGYWRGIFRDLSDEFSMVNSLLLRTWNVEE